MIRRLWWNARDFLRSWGSVYFWRDILAWARAPSFTRFLDHIRHTTLRRTHLDEWSARRKTPTWQHSQQTNVHASGGIRTHNLSRRAAADLHLRPRGHCDRQLRECWPLKRTLLHGVNELIVVVHRSLVCNWQLEQLHLRPGTRFFQGLSVFPSS